LKPVPKGAPLAAIICLRPGASRAAEVAPSQAATNKELVKAALALGYDRRSLEHEPDLTPKSNRVKSQGSSR